MTAARNSAAALGLIAIVAITVPARSSRPLRANATPHASAVLHALASRKFGAHATDTPPFALAVCHDCPASRALVRVLLRRARHGLAVPPLHLVADRGWPDLDALARETNSTLAHVPDLASRLGVTPIAIRLTDDTHGRRTAAAGVPATLALLTLRTAPTP